MNRPGMEFTRLKGGNGVDGADWVYPSHFRPVELHFWQWGFASSHLMRRILVTCQLFRTFIFLANTHLQVMHPDVDLGLYALLRIPFGAPIFDDLANAVW